MKNRRTVYLGIAFWAASLAIVSNDSMAQQENKRVKEGGKRSHETQRITHQESSRGKSHSQANIQYDQRKSQAEAVRRQDKAQERARLEEAQRRVAEWYKRDEMSRLPPRKPNSQRDQQAHEIQYGGPEAKQFSKTPSKTYLTDSPAQKRPIGVHPDIQRLQKDHTLFRSGYFRRTPSGIVDTRTGQIVAPSVQTTASLPTHVAAQPTRNQGTRVTAASNQSSQTPTPQSAPLGAPATAPLATMQVPTQSTPAARSINQPPTQPRQPSISATDAADIQRLQKDTSNAIAGNYGRTPGGIVDLRTGQIVASSPQTAQPLAPQAVAQPAQTASPQITPASNQIRVTPPSFSPVTTTPSAAQTASTSIISTNQPAQPVISAQDVADFQKLQQNTSIAVAGNYGRTPGGIVDFRTNQIVTSTPQVTSSLPAQTGAQQNAPSVAPISAPLLSGQLVGTNTAGTTPMTLGVPPGQGLKIPSTPLQPAQPAISAQDAADIKRLQQDTSIAVAGNYGRTPGGIVDLRTGQIVANSPQTATPLPPQTGAQQIISSNPSLPATVLPQPTLGKSGAIPTTVPDAIKLTSNGVSPASVYQSDGYIYRPTQTSLQHECVALVVALRPDVGTVTKDWSKGTDILRRQDGSYPPLIPGTPIATFKNGLYPADGIMDSSLNDPRKYSHAAIFLGYTYDGKGNVTGMKMDCWRKQQWIKACHVGYFSHCLRFEPGILARHADSLDLAQLKKRQAKSKSGGASSVSVGRATDS